MAQTLHGRRVAMLATDGFEEDELLKPLHALEANGAQVDIISPVGGWIKGWKRTPNDWGEEVAVDVELRKARPESYDALVLPGGVLNADALRKMPEAIRFVRCFADAKKPIGAMCHAPWLLVEAGCVKGRKMTSWASLRSDLVNAGAAWVDEPCVVDADTLVTSRSTADLELFNQHICEVFSRGQRHRAAA
jgi:protease I